MRYYELDAHISDLERSVYETEYPFSLLAAMFILIWLFPPAPAPPPAPAARDKNSTLSSEILSNAKHYPASMLLRFLLEGLPMCDTIQQMLQ